MQKFLVSVCLVLLVCSCGQPAAEEAGYASTPKVDLGFGYEVMQNDFLDLVDTTKHLELLASGFTWCEGPVWVADLNALLFSDVPGNVVYRWESDAPVLPDTHSFAKGSIQGVDTFLYPSGYLANPEIPGEAGANGLLLDRSGFLILPQHGERRVARLAQDFSTDTLSPYAKGEASFEVLTDNFNGAKYNSPNDVVISATGRVLFTDPTYGVDKVFGEEARELDFAGLFVLEPSGEVKPLVKHLKRPNGVVLTPTQDSFILANSNPERAVWLKCALTSGDSVLTEEEGCRLFADKTSLVGKIHPGLPDGMVMHPSGKLFATGPGGVWCFSPSGESLGLIRTGRPTANVTLGGEDNNELYITADALLLRLALR